MKRDKRLYPLSWGHHDLLVYADRVKMALTTDHPSYRQSVEELIEKSKKFWNDIFVDHMNAEKEILFPSLARFLGECQEQMTNLRNEFDEISKLYSEISGCSKENHEVKGQLIRFSDLIIHHVRYEEREIFPKIEAHLPQVELDRIGSVLELKLPRLCRTPLK